MIISYKWLKEFVETDKTAEEIAELLTSHGLETGKVTYCGNKFSNVVTAEILKIAKHPDADKLSICKITDGKEEYQVVCGAKNIFEGAKVPLARIGAKFGKDFEIKPVKLRDVESFGMICSEKELGISSEGSGIAIFSQDTEIGKDVSEIYEMDDYIFEIEITPNRGDCLSMLGVAREISACLGTNFSIPEIKEFKPQGNENLEIKIEAKEACLRYLGYVVENIKNVDTPMWMKNRLRKSNIRSINLVVDITNYILIELGHPMHAFDYEKIENKKIIVRFAKNKEKIVTLDGVMRELTQNDLVIADDNNPIALAGIIGGQHSGVDENTKTIVFESAYFNPSVVRKSAKLHSVSTDSSYRFERGVCFNVMDLAIKRAYTILKKLIPDVNLLKNIDEKTVENFKLKVFLLRKTRLDKIAGIIYPENIVVEILTKLGFVVEKIQDDQFRIEVPSFRNDIFGEIDVIEEVIRIYGVENIPAKIMSVVPTLEDETIQKLISDIKKFFVNIGFYESRNFSFSSKKFLDIFDSNDKGYWEIVNALSEDDKFMVSTRLPRLITNAVNNLNHQLQSVKLFEIGKCFSVKSKEHQTLHHNETLNLAGVVAGKENEVFWKSKEKNVDIYFVSGILNAFMECLKVECFHVEKYETSFFEKGNSAKIVSKEGKLLGIFGKLAKTVTTKFDTKKDLFIWEVYLDNVIPLRNINKLYKTISQYPFIERDLSLIVPYEIEARNILDIIQKETKNIPIVFDVYEGKGIPNGCRNISVRFKIHSNKKTLDDKDAVIIQDKILKKLSELKVKLRT